MLDQPRPSPPPAEHNPRGIVERARTVTGASWTTLQRFDDRTGLIRVLAVSPNRGLQVERAVATVDRSIEGWDVRSLAVPPDVNALHERVHAGETVAARLRDAFEGVLPAPIVSAAERATDAHHLLMVPFGVGGRPAGSIGFLTTTPMDARRRAAAEAFTAQVASSFALDHERAIAGERSTSLLRAGQSLLAADERLRHELSLHLHGRVQTSLLAAGFLLDRCESLLEHDPAAAVETLAAVRVEIDRLREQEIREVSHLLHPSVIDVALTPALRALGDRYEERFTVTVETDTAVRELDAAGDNRLEPGVRLTGYRIVEEALANASRHARPSVVTVRLGLEGEELSVTVADDGVGFDPATSSSGLGLDAIEYRVADVGGRWELETAPGAGTRITAWLPLRQPATTATPTPTAVAWAGSHTRPPGG